MRNVFIVSSIVILLSACSSAVKLDEVKVEDKMGTPVPQTSTDTNGANTRAVESVSTDTTGLLAAKAPAASRIIYFDYDSFAVRPEFQSQIETHAKFMNTNKATRVVVEGHTDERGGREYNLALGQKRAEAVRQSLKLLGVADSQVEAVSFGKEKPAAVGASEDVMAKNRRAELSYR